MRVAVIGAGYVGLVSAACFAELGINVKCCDLDAAKIASIQAGEAPFHEPGLNALLQSVLKSGHLSATRDLSTALRGADLVFITVGTPSLLKGEAADLSAVFTAARSIVPFLKHNAVVVIKSTVPVGTCRKVAAIMREEKPGQRFHIASNPEFLRESQAVNDFFKPDRVVIGCEDSIAKELLHALYAPLRKRGVTVFDTSIESAELIKHASNAFLAMKITYINQISDLCERLQANIDDVAVGIGLDRRIGSEFLQPGPGFGGSCFPKDTLDFSHVAQQCGVRQELIEQTIKINDSRKLQMACRALALLKKPFADKVVGILGVTFKPDTDDLREAPSLAIIPALLAAGVKIKAYDPQVDENCKTLPAEVQWCSSPYEAAVGTDLLLLLTDWKEFKDIDFRKIAADMRSPTALDLRNFIPYSSIDGSGLTLHGLGRPAPWRTIRKPIRADSSPINKISGLQQADMSRPGNKIDTKQRILVAGGAGFIGSHLCARLLRDGHSVVCVDNMKTGLRSNVSIIRRLATSKSFSFKQGDIVAPLITDGHFDAIYNLACPASPVAYQADPVQTLKSSVLGTLNLLELAREHGATMIHASTSEIYGDPLQHPQAESYWGNVNPIGPRACYDEGKRCAETLCFDYRRTRNLHVGVARIFNTYGPRMSVLDGRVVSNFIVQALQNSNITVYGDGRQTRSFCYVDDLIDGLIKLMALSPSVTGPINLGNPQEYSIVDLAALIIDLTGSRSRIIHEPLPIDDPQQRCPDISRAERELKWSPTVPLQEGLNRTIDYFDAVLKREQTGRPSSWSSEELLVAS